MSRPWTSASGIGQTVERGDCQRYATSKIGNIRGDECTRLSLFRAYRRHRRHGFPVLSRNGAVRRCAVFRPVSTILSEVARVQVLVAAAAARCAGTPNVSKSTGMHSSGRAESGRYRWFCDRGSSKELRTADGWACGELQLPSAYCSCICTYISTPAHSADRAIGPRTGPITVRRNESEVRARKTVAQPWREAGPLRTRVQLAVAGTHRTAGAAGRFRMAAKLCRAGLMNAVNQERRCSASAAATAGIRMQCTRPAIPRRWRPVWLILVPNGVPLLRWCRPGSPRRRLAERKCSAEYFARVIASACRKVGAAPP